MTSFGPDVVDVVCLGETMLMVTPADGAPLSADSLCQLRAGGAESNVAVYLAALGHRSAWASRLGSDALSQIVLDSIVEAGVDVTAVQLRQDAPTGVYFKNPGPTGTTVHYYRERSAASTMDVRFIDDLARLRPPVVHVSGITPALSASCRAMMEHLMLDRPFGQTLISFDVNFRPALWGAEAPDELLHFARGADIVFVGLDEAASLWGTDDASSVRELIGSTRALVVKDSDREAVSFSADGEFHEPSLPIDVVEPVGAGDAFAAGWLSGLLRGLDDRARLRLGHRVAASALTSTSDHGSLPSDADLGELVGVVPAEWARRVDPRAVVLGEVEPKKTKRTG